VINPSRTIPKATLIGTLFTSAIYILGTVSVLGAVDPKALQRSVTPFGDAAVRIWGPAARYWVSAGVAVAAFGALNGWILIQGQIPYAIAKDKLFPRIFARENKQGTPALGIVISSVLVTVFTLMNYSRGLVQQFRFLVLLSTLTSLVPYLFSMAAFIVVCLQQRAQVKINWPSSIVLSVLSFGFAFWAIAGAGQEIVYWGFLLLMAGVPLYVWVLRNRMQNP
jgi:APA family basic amino acid/polyamine antiporter